MASPSSANCWQLHLKLPPSHLNLLTAFAHPYFSFVAGPSLKAGSGSVHHVGAQCTGCTGSTSCICGIGTAGGCACVFLGKGGAAARALAGVPEMFYDHDSPTPTLTQNAQHVCVWGGGARGGVNGRALELGRFVGLWVALTMLHFRGCCCCCCCCCNNCCCCCCCCNNCCCCCCYCCCCAGCCVALVSLSGVPACCWAGGGTSHQGTHYYQGERYL